MVLLRLGLNAPGDPARTMLGGTADQAPDRRRPTRSTTSHSNYLVQYFYWLKGMRRPATWAISVRTDLPVSDVHQRRGSMTTLLLGIYAIVARRCSSPCRSPCRQAYRRDRVVRPDRAASTSFMFVAVPAIVLAVFLKLLFVEDWQLVPRASATRSIPWDDPWEHFKNFFLPALTLALPARRRARRACCAPTWCSRCRADFITLASAKGCRPRRILWRHALRNSLFSLLTASACRSARSIGGAIVAETFFDLDGHGQLLIIVAMLSSDLFTVQAIVAILVVAVVRREPGHRPPVRRRRSAHPAGERSLARSDR